MEGRHVSTRPLPLLGSSSMRYSIDMSAAEHTVKTELLRVDLDGHGGIGGGGKDTRRVRVVGGDQL